MAFYHDAPGVFQDVDWYFCGDETGQIEFPHMFYSRIYDIDEYPQDALGERYRPRRYRKGFKPYRVSFGGLCGSEEQWRDGASALDPLPPLYPGSHVPKCCSPPPEHDVGVIEGFPSDDAPKIHPCTYFDFAGMPPMHFVFTFSSTWWIFPTVNVGGWPPSGFPNWIWQQVPALHALTCDYSCITGDFVIVGLIPVAFGFPFQPPALLNARPDRIDTVEPSMSWDIVYPGFIDIPPWTGTLKVTWTY